MLAVPTIDARMERLPDFLEAQNLHLRNIAEALQPKPKAFLDATGETMQVASDSIAVVYLAGIIFGELESPLEKY